MENKKLISELEKCIQYHLSPYNLGDEGKTIKLIKKAIKQLKLTDVVLIDIKKDFKYTEELYTDWFKCPKCKNEGIVIESNYCPHCGSKLQWSTEGIKISESYSN